MLWGKGGLVNRLYGARERARKRISRRCDGGRWRRRLTGGDGLGIEFIEFVGFIEFIEFVTR